jgi:hypothetical protein
LIHIKTRGASHCPLTIYIKKHLKGKRRIMEIQIFHHANLQTNPLKETKSFKISFLEIPHIKINPLPN